jgi:hypothetical protein
MRSSDQIDVIIPGEILDYIAAKEVAGTAGRVAPT